MCLDWGNLGQPCFTTLNPNLCMYLHFGKLLRADICILDYKYKDKPLSQTSPVSG